ncbi:GNAT family N-acetyltransferase [Exilibacterium tricleocarpae]|uniref:GNAT family N-acetyltransferase n=2 Tax=Exilibacterium tricleocarpae TaxID=2591008 RepID=A0A545TM27_9GAMM|nr:GNAT family N-acetyltransferase [Exilibacterium tricleocarpae]
MSAYALDPMGGGRDLPERVKTQLVERLAQVPTALSVLAFAGAEPAGLINCFEGFSTFQCQPLMNIHDVTVLPAYRGRGLSRRMLALVEECARERGCCKLTLEVLEGNKTAQQAYRKFGFAGYELSPATGRALFWEKPLMSSGANVERKNPIKDY